MQIVSKLCRAGPQQNFQFFRQMTWFLGNNRALYKFKDWILHYLISAIKLKNNWSVKPILY